MSASTRDSAPASHNRAATYNVTKDSRRRVKWLPLHVSSDTGSTHTFKELGDPRDKTPSRYKPDEGHIQFPIFLDTDLTEAEDIFVQQTKPILPSFPSNAHKTHLMYYVPPNENQSKVVSELNNEMIRASDDTKSSSESANILKKEDTFIVPDRRSNSDFISPTEELRRRKAMALAKANARHGERRWYDRNSGSGSGQNRKNVNPRSHSNHHHNRAYIECTGSEVRNGIGEKIYFHWRERHNFGMTHLSRVPQGVRKLYAYKRKRLTHKVTSSKSAPNNKLCESNFISGKSENTNRGKTADNDQKPHGKSAATIRNDFSSPAKTEMKTRVAFAISENMQLEKENTDIKFKSNINKTVNGNQTNKHSRPNDKDEKTCTPGDECLLVGTGKCQSTEASNGFEKASLLKNVTSSTNTGLHVQTPVSSVSGKPLSKTILKVPHPPSIPYIIKNSSNVPCEPTNNVFSESKFKTFHSLRRERKNDNSLMDRKRHNNNNHICTTSSKNTANASECNSDEEPANTTTKTPTKHEFYSEDLGIISDRITDFSHSQPIKSSQLYVQENSSKDNNLSSNNRTKQLHGGQMSGGIVGNGSAGREPEKEVYISGSNKVDQNNDYFSGEHGFLGGSSTLKYTPTAGISLIARKTLDEICNDHSNTPNYNIKTNYLISDAESNIIANSNTNIEVTCGKPRLHIRVPGHVTNSSDLITMKAKNRISSQTNVIQDQTDSAILTLTENRPNCDETDDQRSNNQVLHSTYKSSEALHRNKGTVVDDSTDDEINKGAVVDDSTDNEIKNVSNDKNESKEHTGSANLIDSYSKFTSQIEVQKLSSERQSSDNNVHEFREIHKRLEDGDTQCAPCYEQAHSVAIVSNHHIDQRCVNKTVGRGNRDVTAARETQLERVASEPGVQSCVTELTQKNEVIARLGIGWSQQDVRVSIATIKVNREGQFSKPLHSENSRSISMIINSSNGEVPDKQVYNARHDCQSITNEVSKDMLKLELMGLKGYDEVEQHTLSISRYQNEAILPQGGSNLHSDVQQKRNMAANDASPRQSKTLHNLPNYKMQVNKPSLHQAIKENSQREHIGSRVKQTLNVACSTNSTSEVQERNANNECCDDASMASRESIPTAQTIPERVPASRVSPGHTTDGYRLVDGVIFSSCDGINAEVYVRKDINEDKKLSCGVIAVGDFEKSIINPNNTFNDNVSAAFGGSNSYVIPSVATQQQRNCLLKGEQKTRRSQNIDTEATCHSKGKKGEISDQRERNIQQKSQPRTREHERKRQSLSLHKQNMEFSELPKKNGTQSNTSTLSQIRSKFSNTLETRVPKHDNVASKHNQSPLNVTNEDSLEGRNCVINHEVIDKQDMRPKTAGLSAYAKHQNDDLWSVNTDGNEDDDDDDQIQFIEGEQDFYKVFGYNEDTEAILNATKVYLVPSSVDDTVGYRASGTQINSYITDDFHLGSPSYRNVLSDVVVDNSGGYDDAVVSGTRNYENYYVDRHEDVSNRTDQKKQSKLNTQLERHAINPFRKQSSDFIQDTHNGNQGYLNMYNVNRNNHPEPTAVNMKELHPALMKLTIMQDGLPKYGKNIEHCSKNEENQATTLPLYNHTSKGLNSKISGKELITHRQHDVRSEALNEPSTFHHAPVATSQCSPQIETLTLVSKARDSNEIRARRRILSDADIPITSMDASPTLPISDYPLGEHSNTLTAPVTTGIVLPGSKDSKTHVALRNQIATEKHINLTRHHRHISNSVPQYKKSSILQISTITEHQHFRPKDKMDTRHNKNKDSIRPTNLRGLEASTQQELVSVNPYSQAADRIMSRFSDTENAIHNRIDIINKATLQSNAQDAVSVNNLTSSSLRRMSHPVDNTIRHSPHTKSYLVGRPRKLEPILQVPGVKQNQD